MFHEEEWWKYWTKDIQCGAARKEENTDIMKEVHEGGYEEAGVRNGLRLRQMICDR